MIALLTCGNMDGFVSDEHYLESALTAAGVEFEWAVWNKVRDWSKYRAAIIRTTWDYYHDIDAFIAALQAIEESGCKLFNPLSVVKWNSNKEYLLEIAEWGEQIVPTKILVPMEPDDLLRASEEFVNREKLVCKPVVSAGAHDTFVIDVESDEEVRHACKFLKGRRTLVQPFIKEISEQGEYSLHYFKNRFSHGILKTPKAGDFRSQEEFGSNIKLVKPDEQMVNAGMRILDRIDKNLLYARVDWVVHKGIPRLMELELIEPALYFRYFPEAATTMVNVLQASLVDQ